MVATPAAARAVRRAQAWREVTVYRVLVLIALLWCALFAASLLLEGA